MKKSLLWCLIPPESVETAPSYLFGTMHVRDLRAFGWFEMAKKSMDSCSVFAGEFDLSEADAAEISNAIQLPEMPPLDSLLPRGAWHRLVYYAGRDLGMSEEVLRMQHPMMVSGLLGQEHRQAQNELALDEALYRYALGSGKQITGMETFARQVEILKEIPLEVHIRHLSYLAKNYRKLKRKYVKMLEWYNEGDIESLYKSARKDAKGMRKVLLYRRNYHMAARFEELALQQPLFCAVGAGHLAGEKGMLRLLKQRGFRLKALLLPEVIS